MISYISHHTSMYFLHLPSGGDDVPTVVEVVQKHDLDEKSQMLIEEGHKEILLC